jgi:hypothetical protein
MIAHEKPPTMGGDGDSATQDVSESGTSFATSGFHVKARDERVYADVPDGGFAAWAQVVAGHLVIFNCWGYITS